MTPGCKELAELDAESEKKKCYKGPYWDNELNLNMACILYDNISMFTFLNLITRKF